MVHTRFPTRDLHSTSVRHYLDFSLTLDDAWKSLLLFLGNEFDMR